MTNLTTRIALIFDDLKAWRHELHQHPEVAYEEHQTSEFIAEKLQAWGLKVHRGLGGTGVVGILEQGDSLKKIALRADMDALWIEEKNNLPYRSVHSGKMHACGHDGHTAMLLGAARLLAENPEFNGTVYFIFQPAEEGRAGAQQMIADGLFELFPADQVFGMHNFPGIPVGEFAICSGPLMAAFDCFEIQLKGQATHAAMPHLGQDVIVAAAHLITALQTGVSRKINPADSAVLSITQIHSGQTWNALPDTVMIRGTCRSFSPQIQQQLQQHIETMTQSCASAFNLQFECVFNPENPGYPVTFNQAAETELALLAAENVVGQHAIDRQPTPSMGSEDFAFMLQEKPGCYVWLGNGPEAGGCLLHNPHYDFNDDALPYGVAYWIELVRLGLPV